MTKTTRAPTAKGFGRLRRAELVQLGAAIVLGVSLFLPWYTTDDETPSANVEGHKGDVSAWAAHSTLRWFLLAALAAALWSAAQTLTRQQPTQGFRRGETSVVVAVLVTGLVLYNGVIDRSGEPSAAISLGVGWYVALVAGLVAIGAALSRLPPPARKPPGM